LSSLKQKTVSGVFWSVTEKFGIYGVKLITGIILARLLPPKAFGLIGIMMVFFTIAEAFINSGFSSAYVQKKKVSDIDADTIFYTNLILSLTLYLILFLGSPLIAGFYEEPKLIDLIRVMGIIIVINAFNIIQRAQIKRAVNFKKQTKVIVTSTLISGVAGITAAFSGLGVWALVIQAISNRTFIAVFFWVTTKWKPQKQFSKDSFKQMFSFGSWVLLSSLLQKIFDNIYTLTIGKFYTTTQLGFYTKSRQFQRMASENLSNAIGTVAFPVYSKLQENFERLHNAMKKFLQHSMFFMVPVLLGLIVLARPFVLILLTEKWAPMIPYLQLLCIIGILYPLTMVNAQSLMAMGKSKLGFHINLFRNGLRVLNVLLFIRMSIVYIIIGEIAITMATLILISWYNHKYVSYGILSQLSDVWLVLSGGILSGIVVFLLSLIVGNMIVFFITGIITFSIVYMGFQYLFNKHLFLSTIDLIKGLK